VKFKLGATQQGWSLAVSSDAQTHVRGMPAQVVGELALELKMVAPTPLHVAPDQMKVHLADVCMQWRQHARLASGFGIVFFLILGMDFL
jgi:hypothetical protein